MKVGLGGTFNVLHRGHRSLIDLAFRLGEKVKIGITSDSFAGKERRLVRPLEIRKAALEEYLSTKEKPWEIEILNDPFGTAVEDVEMKILIASPGTGYRAMEINEIRVRKGLPPLEIVVTPYVLAEDYLPVSSTRILSGEIDPEGRLMRPLKVVVGSENPVKIRAVSNVMKKILRNFVVEGVRVQSGVGKQPSGEMTRTGAVNRARAALSHGDLGVGIEAGVFEYGEGLYDVQYCAVIDRNGWITVGHGPGFMYPPSVAHLIRNGRSVSEAFAELYGEEDIGRRKGAIGFLTAGVLTREQLTEQAVMAAMVPRIRPDIYRQR